MKALSNLKSAIDQGSAIGIIALVSLLPVALPHLALAATSEQSAKIFEINVSDPSVLSSAPKQNSDIKQNSISFEDVTQADPITVSLQAYLKEHNSPLADYTDQILRHGNWKTLIAISFVESNMCVHNLRYNCSGIGGPGHFYAFKDFGGWIDCMSGLLDSHYNGWSLDKMNGVYVQPRSANWGMGSKRILAELTALEQNASASRTASAQAFIGPTQPISQITALATFSESTD
jgi:hypothetical protein